MFKNNKIDKLSMHTSINGDPPSPPSNEIRDTKSVTTDFREKERTIRDSHKPEKYRRNKKTISPN